MPSELAMRMLNKLRSNVSRNHGWTDDQMLPIIDAEVASPLAENERLKVMLLECSTHTGSTCDNYEDVPEVIRLRSEGKLRVIAAQEKVNAYLRRHDAKMNIDNAGLAAENERLKVQASINRSFELQDDNAALRKQVAELEAALSERSIAFAESIERREGK